MHPLCGAAPEQKGCNAYSSGALPLGTSESVVGWPGLVLWTGCFEGCWLLLVVLRPLARVLVG